MKVLGGRRQSVAQDAIAHRPSGVARTVPIVPVIGWDSFTTGIPAVPFGGGREQRLRVGVP
jgi:hypothetical protein